MTTPTVLAGENVRLRCRARGTIPDSISKGFKATVRLTRLPLTDGTT